MFHIYYKFNYCRNLWVELAVMDLPVRNYATENRMIALFFGRIVRLKKHYDFVWPLGIIRFYLYLQEFDTEARGHGFTRKKLRDRKSNDRATFFPLMNACRGGDLIGSQWDSKYHKNHIIYEKIRYFFGCTNLRTASTENSTYNCIGDFNWPNFISEINMF